MKLIVDARCLQDPDFAFRGVGHHSATILEGARAALGPAVEVVGILEPSGEPLPSAYRALFDRTVGAAFSGLAQDGAVLLQLSPMTHDQDMLAPILKLSSVYKAAILYDFIPLLDPGRYLPSTTARRAYYAALVSLRSYDLLLAISRYTAAEAGRLLGIAGSRVSVTGVSVRDAFCAPDAAAGPGDPGPGEPYFLVVAGDDPRKNVECALRAHAGLGAALPGAALPSLVVLGRYQERSLRALEKLYRRLGGQRTRLRFAEGVSDAALARLYRGAAACLCPSRVEGFSIPVVESIAAGCPVLLSDCSAQQELVPLPEAQFRPDDDTRLGQLMREVLVDPERRARLLELQRPFAAPFARERVTARFWGAIEKGRRTWEHREVRLPRSRPRIAFCTPYPPAASGVADYSARTIRALSGHADVDVLSTQDSLIGDASVRRFRYLTALPFVRDEYDEIVSVVGSSEFHVRIVELLLRYGGACISHDNRMAELYHLWKGPVQFAALASRFLGRGVSIREAEGWLRRPQTLPTLFFEELLPRCEPFVVHSRGIQREIRERHGREVAYLPFSVYRDVGEAELVPAARAEARERLGIPPDQMVIATFGIVSEVKAPLETLAALRQVRLEGTPAHLYLVGPDVGMAPLLGRRAARLGIADAVHLLGRVTPGAYRDFLLAADFGVQLRRVGFGGLSGAALDCLACGLPTVLNHDLAEAMEAPGYVLPVADELEPEAIAAAISRGLRQGLHQERRTEARGQYLEAHSFTRYAAGLLGLLGLAR